MLSISRQLKFNFSTDSFVLSFIFFFKVFFIPLCFTCRPIIFVSSLCNPANSSEKLHSFHRVQQRLVAKGTHCSVLTGNNIVHIYTFRSTNHINFYSYNYKTLPVERLYFVMKYFRGLNHLQVRVGLLYLTFGQCDYWQP